MKVLMRRLGNVKIQHAVYHLLGREHFNIREVLLWLLGSAMKGGTKVEKPGFQIYSELDRQQL